MRPLISLAALALTVGLCGCPAEPGTDATQSESTDSTESTEPAKSTQRVAYYVEQGAPVSVEVGAQLSAAAESFGVALEVVPRSKQVAVVQLPEGEWRHTVEWPQKDAAVLDLNDVRIKLLQLDANGAPVKEGGTTQLKIGETVYPAVDGEEAWNTLLGDLHRFKNTYRGGSEGGVPLILSASSAVPAKYVVRAFKIMAQVKTGKAPK